MTLDIIKHMEFGNQNEIQYLHLSLTLWDLILTFMKDLTNSDLWCWILKEKSVNCIEIITDANTNRLMS